MNRTTPRLSGRRNPYVPDGRRRMFCTFGPPPQAGTVNVVAVEPQHQEPKSDRDPIRNSRPEPPPGGTTATTPSTTRSGWRPQTVTRTTR